MIRLEYAASFKKDYRHVPLDRQQKTDATLIRLTTDKNHPSLRLKRVGSVWSVRVSGGWRILMRETPDGFLVLHLAGHDEYLRLVQMYQ